MHGLAGVAPKYIVLFLFAVATQVIGGTLLPRTEGFHNLLWTVACLGTYGVSFWALAVIIGSGLPLGIVIPLIAASVPLAVVGVSVGFLGETASLARIGTLVVACALVGVAGSL